MGYTTQFTGVLTFKIELGARALAKLSKVLGEDIRELNDEMQEIFIKAGFDHYHLDLELTKDYDGLKWNEAEKTYGMVGAINGIIAYMKPEFPDFALEGMMNAQGEEAMDIWQVVMKDNVAHQQDINLDPNEWIKCPHCKEPFKKSEALDVEKSDSRRL